MPAVLKMFESGRARKRSFGATRPFLRSAFRFGLTSMLFAFSLAADANAYEVGGLGIWKCAQYTASSEGILNAEGPVLTKEKVEYRTFYFSYNQWMYGYISGMNANSHAHRDDRPELKFPSAADVNKMLSFVKSYCIAHPTEPLETAAGKFVSTQWAALGWTPNGPARAMPVRQPPAANRTALVVFQPNLSEADVKAVLEAYKATVVEGPNAEGAYRLQFAVPLTPDQLQQYIESLKKETRFVKDAVAG